jgi:hypothetical protein
VRARLSCAAALLVVIGSIALTGLPASSAVGALSIDEGTSFKASQEITVRYKGFGIGERFFVQQCWDGPSPEFDYALSCDPETMVFPGLIDRDEGTLKFQLFVGDNPSGAFPVSCGPKTDPLFVQHDTCYIRAVTYARERNDLAVFVPITFDGAKSVAAAAAPSVPSTVSASSVAVAATATTPAAKDSTTTSAGASATQLAAKPTITVTRHRKTSGNPLLGLIGIAGVCGLLFIGGSAMARRRGQKKTTVTQ